MVEFERVSGKSRQSVLDHVRTEKKWCEEKSRRLASHSWMSRRHRSLRRTTFCGFGRADEAWWQVISPNAQ